MVHAAYARFKSFGSLPFITLPFAGKKIAPGHGLRMSRSRGSLAGGVSTRYIGSGQLPMAWENCMGSGQLPIAMVLPS
jgi:hypothetical protein